MKGSHYELLGVEKTADAMQIKRAYYSRVKQYPPERFPEEYKELRAAYDTLSDERKRAEYDQARSLPQDAVFLFEQAEKLELVGNDDKAIGIYELILKLYPGLMRAMVALARCFEHQGKIGKAITTWEKVCEAEPEKAEYAYELALACDQRGWNKKATAWYRRALELDSGNEAYWISLINCHLESREWDEARELCEQSLRELKERGVESIQLYSFAFMFSVKDDDDTEVMERYLGDIARIIRASGGQIDNAEGIVNFLFEAVRWLRKPELIEYIMEITAMLPHIDEDLRKQLDEAERLSEIDKLMEHGYSNLFCDIFELLNDGCDCEDCRNNLMAMECHILAEQSIYRPELLRLQKEYPHLYALHASFFNEALRTKDPEKLLNQRMKALSKKGLSPSWLEDEDEFDFYTPAQPISREEPKIGRNDPCPCGSGKKYKKCCGQ